MERFTFAEADWQEILVLLGTLAHPAIRPEVISRVADAVAAIATRVPDAPLTLELDDAGAVAVHRARHQATLAERPSENAVAAIAEAEQIIREHQRRR
ncbi:MAG: hypothetical protein ACKOWF_15830 [Chloroflexota bacterium]